MYHLLIKSENRMRQISGETEEVQMWLNSAMLNK